MMAESQVDTIIGKLRAACAGHKEQVSKLGHAQALEIQAQLASIHRSFGIDQPAEAPVSSSQSQAAAYSMAAGRFPSCRE